MLLEKPKNHTALGKKTFIYRHKKAEWGTVWRLSARIDRIFSPEEKSVTLAIDNCPAHTRIENLKSNCFS